VVQRSLATLATGLDGCVLMDADSDLPGRESEFPSFDSITLELSRRR
jgi:hypothetical protein